MTQSIQWVECPRDAMQGIKQFIPTQEKIEYLNLLLTCGFHTLDAGSFVSPKVIPQLADTEEVFEGIKGNLGKTQLLSIIANIKGAEKASTFSDSVHYIGYPLSVSETFQHRNTNRSIEHAFEDLKEIYRIAHQVGQELIVYLSMGFGNPYGDPYDVHFLSDFTRRLVDMGVRTISLSDTVALAEPKLVEQAFKVLHKQFDGIVFGAHLHVVKGKEDALVKASLDGGCRRFDTAMNGYGGCPMATDELAGNLGAEVLYNYLNNVGDFNLGIDFNAFEKARRKAQELFSRYE